MEKMLRLPGCARECDLRGWGTTRLAREAGIRSETARRAIAGEPVKLVSVRSIAGALDRTPPSATLRSLLGDGEC